jgi:hypothetical protein
MYERNAIVLERYFEKIFGFKDASNLKANYKNYRILLENYENFKLATEAENKAQSEFDAATSEIKRIQKTQEKLYNKGAKFEYNRYIIFNNIEETPESIERILSKTEEDVQKNAETLKELDKTFVSAVIDYNEKKAILNNCIEANKKAKKSYENALKETSYCYKEITLESIDEAKEFIASENKENKKELTNIFTENGKNERNPFDVDVINNTINLSIALYKLEIDIYLVGYDRTAKLLTELDTDTVKSDKHRKYYNDSKLKLDFIFAEKDYLIQFLDNERITAIYDKKLHRKLMLEACRNFNSDLEQINKLYEIIQKEIAGRFTKKLYKENYNKEYLIDLEKSAYTSNIDANKMRTNSVAVMNLNYWRIEGIKRIYEVFDKDISEIYERDLSEFAPVQEFYNENLYDDVEEDVDNNFENSEGSNQDLLEDITENADDISNVSFVKNKSIKKKSKYGILKSSKQALANAIYISLQTHEFGAKYDAEIEDTLSKDEEVDRIFERSQKSEIHEENEDNYFDLDAKIASLDYFDDEENIDNSEIIEKGVNVEANSLEEKIENEENDKFEFDDTIKENSKEEVFKEDAEADSNFDIFDDIDELDDIKDNDESIIELYFNSENEETKKRIEKDKKKLDKDSSEKTSIFKRLIGMNSKKKREA